MAKAKNNAKAEAATATRKETLRADLEVLVNKYNESAEFSEFKVMKKLDEKIQEKVTEYSAECEAECFRALSEADNVMVAAAKALTFPTIKVRDVKQETGGTKREIEDAERAIDPMRLHKVIKDGIGADKLWWSRVERLNTLLTAATAVELNAISTTGEKLDLKTIKNTAMMRDESKKLEMHAEKNPGSDKLLLADLQETINAMLGEGYEATPKMVVYLRKAHERKGRQGLTLVASNHKTMRLLMMDVCNAAITSREFILDYKRKK